MTAGSLPPDCTAAVAVSGSHTCRRVASLVHTKLSLQAHRFARWTPSGAMDPSAGCRWGSGVHAQGVGCECEAGASRGGPLVRSRHKLRDGRPAAQSRPVQWSQAAEACSGVSSLLLFWEPKTSVLEPNRTFWNQIVRFGTITFSVRTLLQLGIFFGCNVYKCVQMCLLEVTSVHRR